MLLLLEKSGSEYHVSVTPLSLSHTHAHSFVCCRSDVGVGIVAVHGSSSQGAAVWPVPHQEHTDVLPSVWRLYPHATDCHVTSCLGACLQDKHTTENSRQEKEEKLIGSE